MQENKALPSPAVAFPPGIPYIVGNEAAERFSFYGMRSILYIHMFAIFRGLQGEAALPAEVADAGAHATQIVHLFLAGVYAFPMIGAIIADRLFGKYPVIMGVSLIYCLGHAVLALAGRTQEGMYIGLALIAFGSGGIKPCVSANVGDQFTAANSSLVSKVFQIFYFIINFGSFFSTIITPLLYDKYGSDVAFALPGILMGIATVVFWLGRDKFVRAAPSPGGTLGLLDSGASILLFVPFAVFAFHLVDGLRWKLGISILAVGGWAVLFLLRQRTQHDTGFIAMVLYAIRNQHLRKPGMGYFDVARERFGDDAAEGPPAVLRIMVVFSMVSVFWALFDQHTTTWIEQAKSLDRMIAVPFHIGWFVGIATVAGAAFGLVWILLWVSNRQLGSRTTMGFVGLLVLGAAAAGLLDVFRGGQLAFELKTSQIQTLNPLIVMLSIPFLNLGVFRPLEKLGITVRPLARMSVGMFLTALSFVAVAILQRSIGAASEQGLKVSVFWQAIPFFLLTTGEVLVSTTGLEFAYTQAPRSMKSTIMGFWLLCVTVGNLLVATLSDLQRLSLERFFWTFAVIMGVAAVIFTVLSLFYRGKSYLQVGTAGK